MNNSPSPTTLTIIITLSLLVMILIGIQARKLASYLHRRHDERLRAKQNQAAPPKKPLKDK